MAKICPSGGGIPGDELSSPPSTQPAYKDQRIVKFEHPVREIRPIVVVPQEVHLKFLLKEDGCECLTESGVLIII